MDAPIFDIEVPEIERDNPLNKYDGTELIIVESLLVLNKYCTADDELREAVTFLNDIII